MILAINGRWARVFCTKSCLHIIYMLLLVWRTHGRTSWWEMWVRGTCVETQSFTTYLLYDLGQRASSLTYLCHKVPVYKMGTVNNPASLSSSFFNTSLLWVKYWSRGRLNELILVHHLEKHMPSRESSINVRLIFPLICWDKFLEYR